MATTILVREDDISTGVACGVGKTREIADDRAIAMYIEREMGVHHADASATADAKADAQADIDAGALVLVRF